MRVIAHMVVGPGEHARYLRDVLERITWWADDIHVSLDIDAGQEEFALVSNVTPHGRFLPLTWKSSEGKFRQAAWEDMEALVRPEAGDYIMCIDADEVVVQHDMIKSAVEAFAGQRLGFRFHEMWGQDVYRVDGQWKPYVAYVLFPYRQGGRIRDRDMACGREPTYVGSVQRKDSPIADLLHYGYARQEDREAKHTRYTTLDAGRYHSGSHIASILYPPSLEDWGGGGGIRVRPD